MNNWMPTLGRPYSPSDLEAVVDDALRVLAEIGVECDHEETRRRLCDREGTRYVRGRVHFSVESVRAHLAARRASFTEPPQQDDTAFSLGGCWAGLNYCDPGTLEVRAATSEETAQMARFWDARGIGGVVPLQPGDVPPPLVTLKAEHIALSHSRGLGGSLTVIDPEEVRFLIEMNLAAGRRYRLMEQTGISPLRLNSEGLETALQFLDSPDVDVSLAGFIPIAGATCPLDPRTALVQSVAETLSHDILCTTLGAAGGGLGLRIEPFDFRYSTIVFGSPEWCLYWSLVCQMGEHLTGRRPRHGRFRSVAKRPDPQAACERTASVLWQALFGVRHFGAAGQLSVDEVFSPQQVIIDQEILGYVERLVRGLDLTPRDVDPVRLIREGLEEGGFVAVRDTVARFREFYYVPELFRHWGIGRWLAEGQPSILSEAWSRAREEMTRSTFQLPDDQQREVDAIFERAVGYIQGRS